MHKLLLDLPAESLMVDVGVGVLQVDDPADHTVDALALEFLLVGVEVLAEGLEVDREHDGAVVQGLLALPVLVSQPQSVRRP